MSESAFLFYYVKATADTTGMNRLERGCYFDIMQAQKKLGRLSIERIRILLGDDFDLCWPRLEMILHKSVDGYYINWLESSISDRADYIRSRAANRSKGKSVTPVSQEVAEIPSTQPPMIGQMEKAWKEFFPHYPISIEDDYPALLDFARFISVQLSVKLDPEDPRCIKAVVERWREMIPVIQDHLSWRKKSLNTLAKFNKQEIYSQIGEAYRFEQKRMIL